MIRSSKYKALSIENKKKIIEAVESGEKKIIIAKKFDIPLSTLSTILKNRDKIVGTRTTGGRKRLTKGEFPHLEECLVTWIRQCRGQNIPVSGLSLKEKAKTFAKNLNIQNFSASEGWLTNFKKRNDIVFKKICGESSSVNVGVCSDWHTKLSSIIEDYEPRNIFNTDETGLFFKCMPDKTFTFKDEKCHGGKHSKERITVLLAVNMNGSEKLKPLIIGKAAKPRCFKGMKSLPTIYRSNKKAWMTTELFNEWLVSLDTDMKKQKRKILLFMDNCTVHNNPPPLSNIRLHYFPPNTTSKLQPLDQGIIHNFKSHYRHEVVKMNLECLENEQNLQKITVLTALLFVDKAWKTVTPSTVFNCFKKSGFNSNLPETQTSEESIALIRESIPLHQALQNVTFEEYVSVDENIAVCGALSDSEIIGTKEDEDDEDDTEPLIPVTLREASSCLIKLRQFYMQSDIDDNVFEALFTLDKTLHQARLAVHKQTKITDFFDS